MRSLPIVCLLFLGACRSMSATQPATPDEDLVLVCRGDAAIPSCRQVKGTQYRAVLRSLDRPLAGAHIAR